MIRAIKSIYFWLVILLVVTAAVYWPGLNGGYAFDDYPNIVFNEPLHVTTLRWNDWIAAIFSSMSSELQRPLAMLTFAINHYFTGLNPWPMKLTNIVIHLVNTILVFGLIRALLCAANFRRPLSRNIDRAALMTTAFWALAPINLMAVLFIVQRMESLSHTFVFAGLWLYVLGRQRQLSGERGWLLILLGLGPCTVIGLLSKESAALLPLYAFCIELCLFHFEASNGRRDLRLWAIYVVGLAAPAIAGGSWLLQRALQPGAFSSRNYTLYERLLTEHRVVFDYLHWTLLPDLGKLSLFHDDYAVSRNLWQPTSTLPAMLALTALLCVAIALRNRRPLVALGVFWFFSAQVLTATIIPLELMFEHRNYFASLGLMLALADLLLIAPRDGWRKVGWIAAALFLLWYGSFTALRAAEWGNPLRFSISEAEKHPQSPRATYQLGQTYVLASDGKPGSPFTHAAILALEAARRVPNGNVLPAQGLLLLASHIGLPLKAEWWLEIEDRLRQHPIGPQERGALAALTECAINQRCHFPIDNMNRLYAAALSRGNDPEVMNIYANYTLNVLNKPELALGLWKISSQLNPHEAVYRISVIKLLIAMGRYDEARAEMVKLRQLGRLGQFDHTADQLEQRIRSKKQ